MSVPSFDDMEEHFSGSFTGNIFLWPLTLPVPPLDASGFSARHGALRFSLRYLVEVLVQLLLLESTMQKFGILGLKSLCSSTLSLSPAPSAALAAAAAIAQARVAPAQYFLSMIFNRLTSSIKTKYYD